MKPLSAAAVNPTMMDKYTSHIFQLAVSAAISALIVLAVDGQTGKTADVQHQYQADKIDSLQARLSRLEGKLIDGAIIVIDCDEQSTGRKTENEH